MRCPSIIPASKMAFIRLATRVRALLTATQAITLAIHIVAHARDPLAAAHAHTRDPLAAVHAHARYPLAAARARAHNPLDTSDTTVATTHMAAITRTLLVTTNPTSLPKTITCAHNPLDVIKLLPTIMKLQMQCLL
ncbi:hypothetical protein RSOL_235530 [Rhizoctonia solani AG-3 Rhs1AP]|uniref:Uncharacterized protein n=1 Tax=Rhizoctonia solani AG-3 Rhs1AP TaxID=1086054 RepID=A0A0A1UHH6_9AGAM|nr:hypothetical protein RSOL_235530 [Rhizoctonia solani AG-3 Rhs1AP]